MRFLSGAGRGAAVAQKGDGMQPGVRAKRLTPGMADAAVCALKGRELSGNQHRPFRAQSCVMTISPVVLPPADFPDASEALLRGQEAAPC